MKKIILLTILIFAFTVQIACADQAERIRTIKSLLGTMEQRSVTEIARDLNKTDFPEGNLQILEAVAQTYHDIVVAQEVDTEEKRKWLYGMVKLNMAYFQFGGTGKERTNELNMIIRTKIKKYLPPEVMNNEELFYSLDYLE